MQTDSSPFGDFSTKEAEEDRDTFSHQTLLLTALTALNNPNNNPTIHEHLVKDERVRYMFQGTNRHTRVMDAVTTILITDKEIIATMIQGVQKIVAVKEEAIITAANKADIGPQILENLDLDLDDILEQSDPTSDKTVFVSFPNIDKKLFKSSKELSSIDSSSTSGSRDHVCKPIAVNKGFWNNILKSNSGFIVDSKKISFEAHVATVQDFLNWYRQPKTNTTVLEKASRLFSEYIVSACWPKMKRRIGHWAAVGMMYKLMEATDTELEARLEVWTPDSESQEFSTGKRSDRKLSECILVLATGNSLEVLLKNYEYIPPLGPTEPNAVLPRLLQQCNGSPQDIYNKETVIEFHHFLVATLLCYAKSLQDLHIEYEKKRTDDHLKSVIMNTLDSIRNYQKGVETNKDIHWQMKRRAPDSNTSMPTLKSFGTDSEVADDCEERKGEEKMKSLVSLFDRELTKALSKAEMKKEKFLPELKSCLERMLNTTPSSPAEPMRTSLSNAEVKMLESYLRLDEKLSSVVVMPKAIEPSGKALAVFFSCRILHKILLSSVFHRHIKFLVSSGIALVPADSQWDLAKYRKFSEKHGIPWQRSYSDKADSEDKANDHDREHDMDDYDRDLERDQAPFGAFQVPETILAVQGWMKLLVQHFHAKSILESFVLRGSNNTPIEIKVYGVSQPKNRLKMPNWTTLVDILNMSLKDFTDEDRAEIIKDFSASLKSREKEYDDNSRLSESVKGKKIFSVLGNIATGKSNSTPRYYNMHCEVALAGLVAASKISQGVVSLTSYADEKVLDDLKALDPKEVAVSKLCCPSCWVYFDILQGTQKKEYMVRGRHSTVYPVQLPIWTSPVIVKELINRFNDLLRIELERMRNRHSAASNSISGHRHTPSTESVLSAVTSLSEVSTSSNLDDLRRDDVVLPTRLGPGAPVGEGGDAPRRGRLLSVD